MVLASDFAQAPRAQPVREWARRVFLQSGGAKQIAHFRPRDNFLWENNRMRLRASAARANSAPSGSKKVRRAFTIRGLLLTKN
jgi:hypothetical protein